MKIQVLSDLHVEFGRYTRKHYIREDVDVVVLAGDIGVDPEHTFNWIDDLTFNKKTGKNYPTVFITGNHEYYHSEIATVDYMWKQYDNENAWFHFLQNGEYREVKGQVFIGGTLWTDFNNDNPITKLQCASTMNDFACIKDVRGAYFTPEQAQDIHYATIARMHKTINVHYNPVVVTHHLPHGDCIHPKFKKDYHGNGAYVTDLDWFFDKHPNIPLWIHGHTHETRDVMIGNTRIVCNPYGYDGHEVNPNFEEQLVLEV